MILTTHKQCPGSVLLAGPAYVRQATLWTQRLCFVQHYGNLTPLLRLCVCRQVLGLAALRATPVLTQRCRDIISTNLDIANGFFARWQAIFDWQEPRVRFRVS